MRNVRRLRCINSRRCPIKMARRERCRLPRPLASAHTNSDLIWHLFSTYFVLMRNFSGCLMCCQRCPRWRRTCLFLADDLHAGLIEIGLPLSTSSFDVILHCEPAFHGPGLSGHSSIRLKQLCTLCAVHILSLQWVPIQISAFHHSPCLFTSLVHFCPFQGSFSCLLKPLRFSLQPVPFCWVRRSSHLRVCTVVLL